MPAVFRELSAQAAALAIVIVCALLGPHYVLCGVILAGYVAGWVACERYSQTLVRGALPALMLAAVVGAFNALGRPLAVGDWRFDALLGAPLSIMAALLAVRFRVQPPDFFGAFKRLMEKEAHAPVLPADPRDWLDSISDSLLPRIGVLLKVEAFSAACIALLLIIQPAVTRHEDLIGLTSLSAMNLPVAVLLSILTFFTACVAAAMARQAYKGRLNPTHTRPALYQIAGYLLLIFFYAFYLSLPQPRIH